MVHHVKALSMRVRPRAYTNGTPYKQRRTRQCKYDRVRSQRYTIQTRRQQISVENINGTPRNHSKALSM